MNTKLLSIILFTFISQMKAESFTCKKLFPKEYVVFFYDNNIPVIKDNSYSAPDMGNTNMEGKLEISLCGQVPIPEKCNIVGNAKLVLERDDGSCLIIEEGTNWDYSTSLNEATNSNKISAFKAPSDTSNGLRFNFICPNSAIDKLTPPTVSYLSNQKIFEVEMFDEAGCGYSLDFLRALNEYPFITGSICLVIGLVLCCIGLKFYRDMISFFIPLMIAVLAFYLYMAIVEKNATQYNKYFLIIGMLFLLVVIIGLAVMFTGVVYVALGKIISLHR